MSVEETYLTTKKQRYIRFHGVFTNNLIKHLMERCGKFCASDLEAFRQALVKPIEADPLIDVYF